MTATAIANLRQYLAYTDYTQYIRQEPIMATGISWHHFFTSFLYWKYVQQILVIQKSVTCFYVVKAVLKRMPNDLTIKQCVLYILSSFDIANIALYTINSKFFHAFFSLLFDFFLFAIMFADTHTTCRNKLSFPNPEEHKNNPKTKGSAIPDTKKKGAAIRLLQPDCNTLYYICLCRHSTHAAECTIHSIPRNHYSTGALAASGWLE